MEIYRRQKPIPVLVSSGRVQMLPREKQGQPIPGIALESHDGFVVELSQDELRCIQETAKVYEKPMPFFRS